MPIRCATQFSSECSAWTNGGIDNQAPHQGPSACSSVSFRNNALLRIAIWAAVSSQAQVEDKDSLSSQKRDGRLWAQGVGGQVIHVFEVPGRSRDLIFFQEAARRIPAYADLARACEAQAFDVLWCRSRDRLGRTDALIAQVEAIVHHAGARVHSALMPTPVDETTAASSIYMSAIERAQSEVETVQRVRRTRMGHRARVRDGLPHGGPPPYGYEYARNQQGDIVRLVPDETEAGALEVLAQKYLRGWGLGRIVQALNDSPYSPRRADSWARTSIRQMLANAIYAGYTHYGDLTVKSDKVDPLWDKSTWRAIQRERASRDPGGREIATALSGIVFCARCGHPMVHGRGNSYAYYRCTVHAHRSYTGETCHPNNTRQVAIARALSRALAPALDADIDLRALGLEISPDISHIERERQGLHEQVQRIEGQRKRLALAFAEGIVETGPYQTADQELVAIIERARARMRSLDQKLARQPTPAERTEALERLRKDWQAGDGAWLLEDESKLELNATLRQLGIRILCEDCEVVQIAFVS